MRDPTLLDVYAAFVAHAVLSSGRDSMSRSNVFNAANVFDVAEALLIESERRHANRN